MILRSSDDEWIVTRQIDHAEVSGQLADLWGNDTFGLPIHRESVVLACGRHDEAWRSLDAQPLVDPNRSQPQSFLSMPLEALLPAYYNGADRVGRLDPYAGFLVSMHYQGFFNNRFGLDPMLPLRTPSEVEAPLATEFFSRMEQLRGRLRTMAAERQVVFGHATSEVVAHAYLLLQVVDGISLFLCLDPQNPWPLGEAMRTVGGQRAKLSMKPVGVDAVEVSPWPFGTPQIEVAFPVRRIPHRKYTSSRDLREVLDATAEETVRYRVRKPGFAG